jgi:signal transduction histidine kinase
MVDQIKKTDDPISNNELDFSFVLASSVHDMKNSLGMLLGSLEEIIDESTTDSDAQKHRFSILQYEATRINTELVQLLSIYRFQHQ